MGFRGEALASIAAVAQVKLKTRHKDSEIGSELEISASKVVRQEPISCPVGSNFMVENLFFNVPARRKFLKTNSTELNNILTAFERITLVYPEIAFSLHSNATELVNLRPGNLRQRIVDVFGKKLNHDLLPVEVNTQMCNIRGFVGKPESAKKKCTQQFFFCISSIMIKIISEVQTAINTIITSEFGFYFFVSIRKRVSRNAAVKQADYS